jgi:hypothetical protein
VRTPQRLYVLDRSSGTLGTSGSGSILTLLQRLKSGFAAGESEDRILDAKVENRVLRVVSVNFDRLDVPLAEVPPLKGAASSQLHEFEIDDDGAFIYWPRLDVHLGWRQLQQLVDPETALRASQKSMDFNRRYGQAVKARREQAGLTRGDVAGLSEKQLARIENGQCRLTTNAIAALAKAHGRVPNDYMRELANALNAER